MFVYACQLMLTIVETVGWLDYLSSFGEIISRNTKPVLYQAKL